jgi:hypothetical protein
MAGIRQSSVRDNYGAAAPVLVADYYDSNDYNLRAATYRFLVKSPRFGHSTAGIPLDGRYDGTHYRMPQSGYVLGLMAYWTQRPREGVQCRVQASINEAIYLDTGMVLPEAVSGLVRKSIGVLQAAPVLPTSPTGFGAGAVLTVTAETSGGAAAGGDLVVEALVGFGRPGGADT